MSTTSITSFSNFPAPTTPTITINSVNSLTSSESFTNHVKPSSLNVATRFSRNAGAHAPLRPTLTRRNVSQSDSAENTEFVHATSLAIKYRQFKERKTQAGR